MRSRTRRNASAIGGGTPDITIRRADADQAVARPYLHRCAGTRFRDCGYVPDHENFLAARENPETDCFVLFLKPKDQREAGFNFGIRLIRDTTAFDEGRAQAGNATSSSRFAAIRTSLATDPPRNLIVRVS